MSAKRDIITLILLLMTILPLNVVAAGQAVSHAIAFESVDQSDLSMHSGGQSAHEAGSAHHTGSAHGGSGHNTDECNDYCMNCLSHCMSQLVSLGCFESLDLDEPLSSGLTGTRLSRAYPLYRPPITC